MHDCICRIGSLARLIVLDGLRRHALIGLVLFALAGITGGLLFIDFIPRDICRAANDFFFSVTWLTGLLFLLFHGVHVMAWDSERGALQTFLARPISRTEYGMALFAGLAFLLLVLNVILGGLGWTIINIIKVSVGASSFQHLSFPFFLLAGVGLYWIQLMMLAIILLFSSAVRGSLPVLLLTLCYYFICSGLPVARSSLKQGVIAGSNQYLENIFKGLTAIFPDFSWLDFKTLAASSDPVPALSQLTMPFGLSTLYIIIVLWLACVIYERRDFQ